MYLRRTQRKRADGSVVGYVQLAHNRRVNGVTRAEVLVNLGREDQLDVPGLRRLATSIARYCGDEPPADGGAGWGEFELESSRMLGGVWLLDGLWKRLGVDRALLLVTVGQGRPDVEIRHLDDPRPEFRSWRAHGRDFAR